MSNGTPEDNSSFETPKQQITIGILTDEYKLFSEYKKGKDISVVQNTDANKEFNGDFRDWLMEKGYDLTKGVILDLASRPVRFKNMVDKNKEKLLILSRTQAAALLSYFGYDAEKSLMHLVSYSGMSEQNKLEITAFIQDKGVGQRDIKDLLIYYIEDSYKTPTETIGHTEPLNDIPMITITDISTVWSDLEI